MADRSKRKPKPESLGEFIRNKRTERRMTLRALARAIGVSAPFMSDVEHDRRRPLEARLSKIAKVLGVRVADLEDRTLTRESAYSLEKDPELLALVRRCRRDVRYRLLLLNAGAMIARDEAKRE